MCLFFIYGCKEKTLEKAPKVKRMIVNDNPDCVDFVALWSAGEIAEKIGKDKKWVFLNYTITLWDNPPAKGPGIVHNFTLFPDL